MEETKRMSMIGPTLAKTRACIVHATHTKSEHDARKVQKSSDVKVKVSMHQGKCDATEHAQRWPGRIHEKEQKDRSRQRARFRQR